MKLRTALVVGHLQEPVRVMKNGLVTKLRLKPPSRDRRTGESSLLGGRSAAATKTASKAETCLIRNDSGFRRCLATRASRQKRKQLPDHCLVRTRTVLADLEGFGMLDS